MIDIVVGGMYCDEGKGKIVNYLARKNNYDIEYED
jgi:adenylosuccinate synthase